MKPQLTHYKIDNLYQETGIDMTLLHIFFKTPTQPETKLPLIITYNKFREFIKSIDEPAYNYLTKIRADIHGYGTKDSAVFKIIDDENFNLEPLIQSYLNNLDETMIIEHYKFCSKIELPENHEKAQQTYKKLDELINDDFKNKNIIYTKFIDEVDQVLHEVTLKFFPELFENDPKHLTAYRNILSRATLRFSEEINNLIHKV